MLKDRSALARPPLSLLINPNAFRKRPWEVNIADLLEAFLDLLRASGLIDLRLCGSAALSSALLYRLKVETMFLFEKLRPQRRQLDISEPPQVIPLPFRYELRSTDIEDLLRALEKIVEDLLTHPKRERGVTVAIEPEPEVEFDHFLADIRAMLASFQREILRSLAEKGRVLFSEYFGNRTLVERVKAFILLLFLASEGVVTLEQQGEDILISGEHRHAIIPR